MTLLHNVQEQKLQQLPPEKLQALTHFTSGMDRGWTHLV